jgi:ribose-phosphate pyrophosphokinase
MLRAALACRERGAIAVHAMATHGLFGDGAEKLFGAEEIDRIIVTDSVSAAAAKCGPASSRVELVSVAPLIAEAIRRLHEGEAISDLTGIGD